VAIAAQGQIRQAGRIETSIASLELFAGSLATDDEVVLEATGPAFAIARILKSHVARVVVANAQEVRAISHARVKSDRFDAATLARLLSADLLAEVWVCDERIGALRRRLARRGALVRQRTRAKAGDAGHRVTLEPGARRPTCTGARCRVPLFGVRWALDGRWTR
jgi:transposase